MKSASRKWSDIQVLVSPDAADLSGGQTPRRRRRRRLRIAVVPNRLRIAPKPVVLRVDSPTMCVFQGAQPGTNRFYEVAVTRKNLTVMALGHRTFWWNVLLAARGSTAAQHPLADDGRYTDIPGGFPLRAGDSLLESAAISGLAAPEDHALLVAGLESTTV